MIKVVVIIKKTHIQDLIEIYCIINVSKNLESIEDSFIAITPYSNLSRSGCTCFGSIYWQIGLFKNYSYSIKPYATPPQKTNKKQKQKLLRSNYTKSNYKRNCNERNSLTSRHEITPKKLTCR